MVADLLVSADSPNEESSNRSNRNRFINLEVIYSEQSKSIGELL